MFHHRIACEIVVVYYDFTTVRLRESWIRGYPNSRTIFIVRTIGASRYKTQDSGSCPDGTLHCVEDKLGDSDIMFPSL